MNLIYDTKGNLVGLIPDCLLRENKQDGRFINPHNAESLGYYPLNARDFKSRQVLRTAQLLKNGKIVE